MVHEKLNKLEDGNVLDISQLNEEEAETLKNFYGDNYFIRGPVKESNNKYALAISKINYLGVNQNA